MTAIQELASLGVRFIAASQGLDTDQFNPTAQLLLHILASVAQFERELIRERVSAGMRNAKKQGRSVGRPKRVFDHEEVVRLRRQGLSIAKIASRMGLGAGTVVRALRAVAEAPSGFQNSTVAIGNGVAERPPSP